MDMQWEGSLTVDMFTWKEEASFRAIVQVERDAMSQRNIINTWTRIESMRNLNKYWWFDVYNKNGEL